MNQVDVINVHQILYTAENVVFKSPTAELQKLKYIKPKK